MALLAGHPDMVCKHRSGGESVGVSKIFAAIH
jgi:hypothetical protein